MKDEEKMKKRKGTCKNCLMVSSALEVRDRIEERCTASANVVDISVDIDREKKT